MITSLHFSKMIKSRLIFIICLYALSGKSLLFADNIAQYVEGPNIPASPSKMTFVDNDQAYLQLSADCKKIDKYDTKTGKFLETVFSVDRTRQTTDLPSVAGFILSPEESKLLVWRNKEEIYRHSFSAEYYIYEFRSRLLTPLSEERKRQEAPLFSPDGRMVAYAYNNNLYIKKLDYGTDIAVTTDGKKNYIINGIPDWVYQEEFETTQSFVWSPDNLTLCYIKYNETDVPSYTFPLYAGACPKLSEYELYPGEFTYKYPVAGQNNSKISLHSYNIETRKTLDLTLPDQQIEYIPRIFYTPTETSLLVLTLNRDQNRMEVYSVNPKSNVAKSVLVETSTAWIEPDCYENFKLYPDFFVMPSSRSGHKHYYKYSYTGASLGAITSGNFDVTEYYGFTTQPLVHYYQSTASGAINRVISKIDSKGKVTDITPTQGYGAAIFSPTMAYYIETYSNATTVPVHKLMYTSTLKPVRTLVDNASYSIKFADTPKPEFFKFNANGVELNGMMVKPTNFNPTNKYPVIMNQYSGPGSQEVLNRWSMGWENYFATQGYLVVSVDGRGTGGRGRDFMTIVYKNLGYYESIDQNAAANYVASLPYVDSSRIGIYGWSYGGYETIMAASTNNAPYAAAVAVAPVTDWRFYDSIYTERYMLTPQQNSTGYSTSSTTSHINNLKCPLLIIHGTADDNVHIYNTLQYITDLGKAGRWCDFMPVINANHSIRGCSRRSLVYDRMLEYFNNNMK